MYKILGADQKEYGPVSVETLQQWVIEGRANANTMVQAEGSAEWKRLAELPEFASVFPPVPVALPVALTPEEWSAQAQTRDYNLEIGACLSRGWNLVTKNFGLLGGATAIFLVIQIGLSMLGSVPLLGILVQLGSFLIIAPLIAGLYLVFLKTYRGQPGRAGDVFNGFGPRYGQILLVYIVPALIMAACLIPGGALILVAVLAMGVKHGAVAGVLVLAFGVLAAVIPMIYLSVSWAFTLLLVVDKNLDFWLAMQTSRKMTGKHFWAVFGLMFVAGLVGASGLLACCVGVFFTLPVAFAALTRGYEIIFDNPSS